jgi:hypothetical protein
MRSVACHLETDTNQKVIKTDLIIFHSRSFKVYNITFVVNTLHQVICFWTLAAAR